MTQTTRFDEIDFRIATVKRLKDKLTKNGSLSVAEEISLVGNIRILDNHFDMEISDDDRI